MNRGQGAAEYALVLALVAIVVIVALMLLGGDSFQEWAVWCGEQGGRVVDQHSSGIGVGSNGQTVATSSTSYFCLSDDGRILDVR